MQKRGRNGRFQAGKSGNPGGRPKAELCLAAILREALAERDPTQRITKARIVIDALILAASEGDTRAQQILWDRVDGPAQPVKLDLLDIGALIEQVKQRADDRRSTRNAGGPAK